MGGAGATAAVHTEAAHFRACPKMTRRRGRGPSPRTLAVKQAIVDAVTEDPPMTVRQVFYRLVVAGAIDKTEKEYQQTVIRLLTDMRLSGEIDFEDIIDESRRIRETQTFDSVRDALQSTARYYRRSALQQAGEHVEIWCEKDALAGVIWDAVAEYDVPLLISRGMPSLTFLYGTALRIKAAYEADKRTVIYQFGDHDPTGVLIPQTIGRRLRELCAKLGSPPPIVKRVALTVEQIHEHDLPTRPTKRAGNSHAKNFDGDSVELDALPPQALRDLVGGVIEQHISAHAVKVLRAAEESERQILQMFATGERTEPPPQPEPKPSEPKAEWDDWDKAWLVHWLWLIERSGYSYEGGYYTVDCAFRYGDTPTEALRNSYARQGRDGTEALNAWAGYLHVHADWPREQLNKALEEKRQEDFDRAEGNDE